MNAITYTDLKQNLDIHIDKIIQNNQSLMVSKKDNEKIILMPENEYNSLMETNYLLSNDANIEHLKNSITQHKLNNIVHKELYEDD